MSNVSLNPKRFQDIPLCELPFEDALAIGQRKSEKLGSQDFRETSIRFCVDGLYKWYKSFAQHHQSSSVFTILRDASWWWASFCSTDPTLTKLVKEYFTLLKDITENTPYVDLVERMDEADRLKEVGRRGYPFSVLIPSEAHGVMSDCAAALGVSFSLFFQVGLGKALAANRQGLYSLWVERKVTPLFDETMASASSRLRAFQEINATIELRQVADWAGETVRRHKEASGGAG